LKEKLVIWGASGHAKIVTDIFNLSGIYEVVGYLDNINIKKWGTDFYNSKILGGDEQIEILLNSNISNVIVGFGNNKFRMIIASKLENRGFNLVSAIHPGSILGGNVQIGKGSVVAAGCIINCDTTIGKNVIINTSSSVDHDCTVRDGVHISPGSTISGRVNIGEETWIGAGTTIIDHITIGKNSIVGAGSLVIRDIPDNVVVYGVPARIVKNRE
jgi:UDP-N-acetylbacillosamine N-acetyltransferase